MKLSIGYSEKYLHWGEIRDNNGCLESATICNPTKADLDRWIDAHEITNDQYNQATWINEGYTPTIDQWIIKH